MIDRYMIEANDKLVAEDKSRSGHHSEALQFTDRARRSASVDLFELNTFGQ